MADYLKIPEVARRLDVSEKTARRYVKDGTLPSVFVGGAYRVSEEDLEDYLQSARVQPGKAPSPALQLELEEQRGAGEQRRDTEELDVILVEGLAVQGERIVEELQSSVSTVPMRTLNLFALHCATADRLYEELHYNDGLTEQLREAKKRLDDIRYRVAKLADQLLNPGDARTALTRQLFARRRGEAIKAQKVADAKDVQDPSVG